MNEFSEPWTIRTDALGWQLIYTGKGNEIEGTALMPHKQRARAVACVNAMAGIPSDRIVHAREELAALRKERDAALACLKLIAEKGGRPIDTEDYRCGEWCAEQAREVLKELKECNG